MIRMDFQLTKMNTICSSNIIHSVTYGDRCIGGIVRAFPNFRVSEIFCTSSLWKAVLDFYAPQTLQTVDGRRIMIGWMQSWDAKLTNDFWNWSGMMTLPRELILRKGKIYQSPVRELECYRKNKIEYTQIWSDIFLNDCIGEAFRILHCTQNG